MPEFPKMRARDMNELVSMEMPAHMWVSLMAAYAGCEWHSETMDVLIGMVQEAMLDPIYFNEKMAEMQEAHDQHFGIAQRWTGFLQGAGRDQDTIPDPEEDT